MHPLAGLEAIEALFARTMMDNADGIFTEQCSNLDIVDDINC